MSGAGQLGGAAARTAEPLVLVGGGARGEALAAAHAGQQHRSGDHHEQQQRHAAEQQHGVQRGDRVGVAPALRDVGARGAGEGDQRGGGGGRGGDEDDAPAREGLEDGSHDEQDIRMPRRALDRSGSNGSHPARGPDPGPRDV